MSHIILESIDLSKVYVPNLKHSCQKYSVLTSRIGFDPITETEYAEKYHYCWKCGDTLDSVIL